MSKQPNPATVLANLLSGLSTGAVKVVELNIDPNLSAEEQISTIADQMAAQHRETCSACRERYEREHEAGHDAEVAAAKEASNKVILDTRAAADTMREAVSRKVAFEAPYGDEGKPKATYHEVGFMAYQNGVPIPTSFDADRSVVEAKLKLFSTDPIVKLLGTLTGTDPTKITIRPVYDER